MSVERDIGELKEHAKWMKEAMTNVEKKLDVLNESHLVLKIKFGAIAAAVAVISAGLFQIAIASVRYFIH
jgi:hypothetical protein